MSLISGTINLHQFTQEVLTAHNACRLRHGAPPLELDASLTAQSQECAESLLIGENVDHLRGGELGENIFIVTTNDPNSDLQGSVPVNAWYQQRFDVDISKEPVNNKGVNFSQVVWKSTQFLGVGVARSANKIIIVCYYMPPGNIYGEYVDNVFPEVNEIVEEEQGNADEDDTDSST